MFWMLFKKKEESLWSVEEERKASAKEAREEAEKRKGEGHTSNPDTSHFAFAYVWGKYREYALPSRKRKAELTAWRFRVLLFGITGAILGTLCQESIRLGFNDISNLSWVPFILGLSSAAAMGFAAYFGKELVNPYQEQRWIRSRSVAEALKSEVYLFRANSPPYDTDRKPEQLIETVEVLLKKVEDLPTEIISKEQKQKGLPREDLTVEDYIETRVNDQIVMFYRPQSNELKQKMKRNKNIGLSLGCFSVILGALGLTGWTAGWIAVIGTITASITAFAYAGRYQYLIISYQTTADKLEQLCVVWKSKGKTDEDTLERNEFIHECEAVISIENSAWMAEMTK